MRENRLVIQIKRKPEEIIAFCLDPKNTPKWINSIVVEETNEWPVRVGTIYRNQNRKGEWAEYKVVALSPVMFEFASTSSTYHVRYTCTPNNDRTDLEYCEWMGGEGLLEPFSMDSLQELKLVLEN